MQLLGFSILWNGAPLSLQSSSNGSIFTQNNGKLWNGRNVYYYNLTLPTLPLPGTNDISTGKYNTLYLPSESTIWRVTFDKSLSNFSWEFVAHGRFLNDYSDVLIHRRLMAEGAYIVDNTNALFLFKREEDESAVSKPENGMLK